MLHWKALCTVWVEGCRFCYHSFHPVSLIQGPISVIHPADNFAFPGFFSMLAPYSRSSAGHRRAQRAARSIPRHRQNGGHAIPRCRKDASGSCVIHPGEPICSLDQTSADAKDCLYGIHKAMDVGLLDLATFDKESYRFYEKVE